MPCRLKVMAALAYPITWTTAISVLVALYEKAIRKESWWSLKSLDAALAYSLVSFALSLLLVFKTNTAYARFWEARSAWGAVYTDCRMFILKSQALCRNAPDNLRKAILRWTIALPYAMRTHLTNYKPGADSLELLLTQAEVKWLRDDSRAVAPHQPIRAVGVLMSLVAALNCAEVAKMELRNLLTNYLTRCGLCEKIRATPIPMPYTDFYAS
jgi:ion channel-forming bestrophin family protein